MNIKIEGNPGTGNTFMEINIQHVEHFHTTAPDMPINNNGSRARTSAMTPNPQVEKDTRSEILTYVNSLRMHLADEWKSKYNRIWEEILDIEIISASIFHSGKQQGTNFNRNLVANIIHYLSEKGVYGNAYYTAKFAEDLEGNKDHSVRSALGKNPADDIVSRLNRYFER